MSGLKRKVVSKMITSGGKKLMTKNKCKITRKHLLSSDDLTLTFNFVSNGDTTETLPVIGDVELCPVSNSVAFEPEIVPPLTSTMSTPLLPTPTHLIQQRGRELNQAYHQLEREYVECVSSGDYLCALGCLDDAIDLRFKACAVYLSDDPGHYKYIEYLKLEREQLQHAIHYGYVRWFTPNPNIGGR